MSFLAFGPIAAIVLPLSYLTWSLVGADRGVRKTIKQNLGLSRAPQKAAPTSLPDAFTGIARRMTSKSYAAWLDRKLAAAGRPKAWPLNRLLVVKPLLAFVFFALGVVLVTQNPTPQAFLIVAAGTAFVYFVPDVLLHNTAQKRRLSMQRSLPTMLDQMLISVEAGVGFEAAMDKAARSSTGPLADEFVRTLQDIQVGRQRREAYLDMAQRANVPELRSFVRAVVQADQYGIAIANVLRSQAREMRIKRRQRAEEHAMKIPVKILFPLIFAILPSLFVIILGPTVLNIIKAFS
ncbi:type II secretion system F family protein [Sinomonas sp. ASV322]|uniref:type II secretion system F family protein n=1 Tax=Sinomonas sp. ASV322 TaxID=3041920 RepID=UPI0027DAE3A1|nr:type II secretion system F family protein [Sinomonas sp. ASV322]MDQ4501873.1 type II secretion system F family protein [Sinomonas sp. ASV322]